MEDLKTLGDIDMSVSGVNPKLLSDFLKGLRGVDGAEDFIRETMSEDVKRYFNASTPMEQLMIKGGYFRMKYLLTQLQKVDDKKPAKEMKLARYAR